MSWGSLGPAACSGFLSLWDQADHAFTSAVTLSEQLRVLRGSGEHTRRPSADAGAVGSSSGSAHCSKASCSTSSADSSGLSIPVLRRPQGTSRGACSASCLGTGEVTSHMTKTTLGVGLCRPTSCLEASVSSHFAPSSFLSVLGFHLQALCVKPRLHVLLWILSSLRSIWCKAWDRQALQAEQGPEST